MSAATRRRVVLGLAGIHLAGLAFLTGVAVERVRFDVRRTARVHELDTLLVRARQRLMDLEVPSRPLPSPAEQRDAPRGLTARTAPAEP